MKKVILIMFISAITFIGGSFVVYHNTSSIIYDDVSLFTIYNDGFKIMDFRFIYS